MANVLQGAKSVLALNPQSINGTDTLGTAIDTLGFSYANLYFMTGLTGAADFDELTIAECDTVSGTYVDIDACDMVDPLQTQDNLIWQWGIALGGTRKRFLKIHADPGAAASLMAGLAILTKGNVDADTDTERGVVESIFI